MARPTAPRTAANIGSRITALLGPTNTGKTHRAVERMLSHDSGMLGFPLRLLAREVYDKIAARIGFDEVALITGEEKHVPRAARYFVCTVEAMPLDLEVDFLGVDEIQLAAHPQRGHTFTDRLLYRRGRSETWFLGSQSVEHLVEELVPTARIRRHPRLSELRGAGQARLGQLKAGSAVVAFTAARVYELAERVRRRKGGAAVVLGALSPRARNAQVALYQSGDVDYLVATDAIGMGLNLSINHVAFADVRKFDGQKSRHLELSELGQIAGRAGRHLQDGSFGTLAPEPELPFEVVQALETHHFPREKQLWWRNPELEFHSLEALLESLRAPAPSPRLKRMDQAEDHLALERLSALPSVADVATGQEAVELLLGSCADPRLPQGALRTAPRAPRSHLRTATRPWHAPRHRLVSQPCRAPERPQRRHRSHPDAHRLRADLDLRHPSPRLGEGCNPLASAHTRNRRQPERRPAPGARPALRGPQQGVHGRPHRGRVTHGAAGKGTRGALAAVLALRQ
ncbi:MAG: helicase-related protein [Polyangiaceae bacterium]